MRRFPLLVTAWFVGWVVYMIAMVLTVYDGITSLIFQPVLGAIVSALCVTGCFLIGLIFRIPTIGRVWSASRWTSIFLAAASIGMLILGSAMGLTQSFVDPETQTKVVGLRSDVAIACYFVLLFSITNFPLKNNASESHGVLNAP